MKTQAEIWADKCCNGSGCPKCQPKFYTIETCKICGKSFEHWELENGQCEACDCQRKGGEN